jgi:hypothetical protein
MRGYNMNAEARARDTEDSDREFIAEQQRKWAEAHKDKD